MDLNELREELSKSINDFLLSCGIEPVYLFTVVCGFLLYSSIGDIKKDNPNHFDWILFVLSLAGFLLFLVASLLKIFD